MRQIDQETWNRREHFEFFRRSDLPFYNVNTMVDITGIRDFAKGNNLSFNNVLIFLTVKALNEVENFRYRLHGDTVILHDQLNPSFAYLGKPEELFGMITVDFVEDIFQFDELCKKEIEIFNVNKAYFDLAKLGGRDDFVFISSFPWISFTGIDHTMSLKKDDAIPRVSWGKYDEQAGRSKLPYNIQVNHVFVDGLHVGRFFEKLDRLILETRNSA